jgi:hypothetical protein
MRTRAYRRHKAYTNMKRRLQEDRNQHYTDLTCPCWSDPVVMAWFKEQPKRCSCSLGCGNGRRHWGYPTIQELRQVGRVKRWRRKFAPE